MGILRVLLALAVVIAHSSGVFGISSVGGQVAVEAFYIISGFYMSLILNEKYIKKIGSYKLFITNRFLRLFPVYWCVLILVVVFSLVVGFHSHGAYWGRLQSYSAYFHTMSWGSILFLGLTNIIIFFQDLVMFLGVDLSGHLFFTSDYSTTSPQLHTFLLIPQAWTIGIELLFYLVAPFIVRKKTWFIFLLISLSLIVRYILFRNNLTNDPWSYRFFPAELFFFLLGVLSYKIFKIIEVKPMKTIYLNITWIAIIVLTVLFDQFHILQKENLYFLLFFIALPFIFRRTKNNKIDSYIGELSYPIYISHIFILSIINAFNIKLPGGSGITLICCTIIFSLLVNELISKKIEKRRQNRVLAAS